MDLHSKNSSGHPWRVLGSIVLVITVLFAWSMSPAWADSDKRIVKVMTRNMDAGTDFLYFFGGYSFSDALTNTFVEITTNDFSGRAARLADEIASEQPYLISLQEVTLWQFVLTTGSFEADQLTLLLAALAARNLHYEVVASQNLTDITIPLSEGEFFHFLDRNAVLARSDLQRSELALSNIQTQIYKASINPIPTLPSVVQLNGWISLDAKIRGKSICFYSTHLESQIDSSDKTQERQARELIHVMRQCKLPVVLAGDFNSDAAHTGIGPDQTPTAGLIVAAGYQDVWSALHPRNLGLTWPLYFEDFLANGPVAPFERIDLIFVRDLTILDAQLTGTTLPYASDHAGVVSTLRIDK
ncbi:MAG: endonuclease/exonuclease/phosphatase family protein [Syntrophales bacterium]